MKASCTQSRASSRSPVITVSDRAKADNARHHTLVRNLAWSLMRNHIRVNLVNLGWMDTPHEDEIQRRYHGAGDGWLAQAEAEQPFGRLIKPPEVARILCFLLSDESGLMTGASIDFDQSILGAGYIPKPGPELFRTQGATP